MKELNTLIPELRQIALDSGASELQQIPAGIVKTAAWVRFKCRYGCKAYGKHISCPPYSPTHEETENVLRDYEHAALIEFIGLPKETAVDPRHLHHYIWDLSLAVHNTIYKLSDMRSSQGTTRHSGSGHILAHSARHAFPKRAISISIPGRGSADIRIG